MVSERTGEQLQMLELILQVIARLDQLGMDGEVRLVVRIPGGAITIAGKSKRAAERKP